MTNKKIAIRVISLSLLFLIQLTGCTEPTIETNNSNILSSSSASLLNSSDIISSSVSSNSSINSSPPANSSSVPSSSTVTLSSETEGLTLPNFSGKSAKILIMGNSFLGSSQVDIYVKMIAQEKEQSLEVKTEGRGNYSVERFYNDIEQFPEIKEGYYDVIFLSGLYGYNDLEYLAHFIDILKNTKTKLAVFPADNESPNVVYTCKYKHEEDDVVYYADWNTTLDILKTEGFTEYNLNIDDYHKHSNELAGYVGACVIYSFLYNTMPNCITTANYMIDNYNSFIPGITLKEQTDNLKKIEKIALQVVIEQ